MDSASPHLPSPLIVWTGRPAAHVGDAPAESGASPLTPQLREDDASQLRARLLRMIVDSEHARKAAAL